ncbi:uncharacterized protein LOC115764627 [Drosophila novamexicana]|uniref:uncharacterized protein LOC115764627 n=1 Tax=Drosophila novamexicana TaxID=47314 RepID=UPI0011E5ACCC|nr:uncharacterized protein LOC115764627 [Drosophila novamexicana]
MACKFVFDIIVTHFESSVVKINYPTNLSIVANFNNINVPLTSSRINVSEFKSGAGVELNAAPKKMRANLQECGMVMTVSYNAKVIGAGQIMFPQTMIDKIEAGMTDLMHVGSCDFEKEGESMGNLEVLCRLIIKCEEQSFEEQSECRRNIDKCINQEDIMFIVSESQRCPSPCDPCLDALEPEAGDELLKLDMARYRSSNAGGYRPAENLIHNPVENSACCQLKRMAEECEEIVDSIIKRSGHPKPLKSPCRRPEEQGGPCSGPFQYFQEDNQPLRSYVPCFSYMPARQDEGPDFCNPALIPVPISDLPKPSIKPARFCPVCLTNMSWLPKFATCPTCGVKPMPVVEERHKETKLTSEKIIAEFLGKTKDSKSDYCVDPCESKKKQVDDDECRNVQCTCKCGKMCTHCRIRKLCGEIFEASKNEATCPSVKPKSSEDFCVIKKDSNECRPHLARVFSELRDLYEVKNAQHPSQLKLECGQKQSSNLNQSAIDKKPKLEQKPKQKPTKSKQPGVGHKQCPKTKDSVSRRHGWAWKLREEAKINGWRPGFVRKSVKRLMKFFLQYSPENKAFNKCQEALEAEKERQPPTLHVCKKNGEIFVTLRALDNKNMQMKPIVFRVVKSDLAVALREIKKKLKDKGFRKCTCHKTVMLCVCRDILEKKHLEYALQKECKRRGMENCVDHLVLTDTSDSEMEYDFDVSPPAASARPPRRRKNANNGTQTNKKDLVVPSKYPITLSPYWRVYDCAAGDRYTGKAFGGPGENVFEDGIFGYGGGGPQGASNIHGTRGGGPGGVLGGKSFPGNKKQPGQGKSEPIPVKMLKRHIEAIKNAAKAEKEAIKNEIERKKKGINLIKYLEKHGAVPTPWDPNNPQPKKPVVSGPVLGPDGLTDAQRKRRLLQQTCVPPLDSMPRLGKGYDPCQCYNTCVAQCCYPCCYC